MPGKMMKAPKASNYIGNPMGYFNDKAMYGREKMMNEGGPIKINEAGDRQKNADGSVTPTGKTYETTKNRDVQTTKKTAQQDSKRSGTTTTSTLYNKDRSRKSVKTYKDGKLVSTVNSNI